MLRSGGRSRQGPCARSSARVAATSGAGAPSSTVRSRHHVQPSSDRLSRSVNKRNTREVALGHRRFVVVLLVSDSAFNNASMSTSSEHSGRSSLVVGLCGHSDKVSFSTSSECPTEKGRKISRKPCGRTPGSQTPGVSTTPKPSTTNNCWPSRAHKLPWEPTPNWRNPKMRNMRRKSPSNRLKIVNLRHSGNCWNLSLHFTGASTPCR